MSVFISDKSRPLRRDWLITGLKASVSLTPLKRQRFAPVPILLLLSPEGDRSSVTSHPEAFHVSCTSEDVRFFVIRHQNKQNVAHFLHAVHVPVREPSLQSRVAVMEN